VAFKGVLVGGVEIVAIVTVLAARPSDPAPALVGAGVARVWLSAPGRGCTAVSQVSEIKLVCGAWVCC
jgi:uncharacterized membrane protein